MKLLIILTAIIFAITFIASAQDLSNIVDQNIKKDKKDFVFATFKAFRIVNAQTNETPKKHNLEFNIAHRFGDLAGTDGGVKTFFGLETAPDVRFSFDYGVTDKLMLGIGRTKGIQLTQLFDGNLKYKLLQQTTVNKIPLALTLFTAAVISTQKAKTDPSDETSFPKWSNRLSYCTQLVIARKFSQSFSFEVLPTYLHRNYVRADRENDFYSIGAGARLKLSKRFALIADYFYNLKNYKTTALTLNNPYRNPLGVGFEIETGGHVFSLDFTNSTGIIENEYLPFTTSDWLRGQFRFGFNIGRNFLL